MLAFRQKKPTLPASDSDGATESGSLFGFTAASIAKYAISTISSVVQDGATIGPELAATTKALPTSVKVVASRPEDLKHGPKVSVTLSTKAAADSTSNASFRKTFDLILHPDTVALLQDDIGRCVGHHGTTRARCKNKVKIPFTTLSDMESVISNAVSFHRASQVPLHELAESFFHRLVCGRHLGRKVPSPGGIRLALQNVAQEDREHFLLWLENVLSSGTVDFDASTSREAIDVAVGPEDTRRASTPTKQSTKDHSIHSTPSSKLLGVSLHASEESVQASSRAIPLRRKKSNLSIHTPQRNAGKILSESISNHLYRRLRKDEIEEGHIYMYWDDDHPEIVKIGKTERDVGTRMKEWQYKCKHQIIRWTSFPTKNVGLVEKLIHAILDEDRRRKEDCECSKRHMEWFETDQEKAENVFKLLRDYFQREPYDTTGDEDDRIYTPKKEGRGPRVDKLCEALAALGIKTPVEGPRVDEIFSQLELSDSSDDTDRSDSLTEVLPVNASPLARRGRPRQALQSKDSNSKIRPAQNKLD